MWLACDGEEGGLMIAKQLMQEKKEIVVFIVIYLSRCLLFSEKQKQLVAIWVINSAMVCLRLSRFSWKQIGFKVKWDKTRAKVWDVLKSRLYFLEEFVLGPKEVKLEFVLTPCTFFLIACLKTAKILNQG